MPDDSSLSVTDVLERAREAAEDQGGEVTMRELLRRLGARAHGPALLLLAGIALIPVVGGIPGVGFLITVLVLLLMGHLLISGGGFYLPPVLGRRSVDAEALEAGLDRVRPWAERLERVSRPRLGIMLHPVAVRLAAVVCIALALTMFPLGLVPFAVTVPSFVLGLFGLALVSRDGVVMALAFALSLGAFGFAWWILPE